MKTISNAIHRICRIFLAADLLVVTVVLTVNVILRYCFSSSWVWSEELSQYLIAWATFVGAACCVEEGSDITIDSILAILPHNGKKAVRIISYVLCVLFSLLFVYSSALITMRAKMNGTMATSMELPIWIVYLSMPVGGLLVIFRTVEKLVSLVTSNEEVNI